MRIRGGRTTYFLIWTKEIRMIHEELLGIHLEFSGVERVGMMDGKEFWRREGQFCARKTKLAPIQVSLGTSNQPFDNV